MMKMYLARFIQVTIFTLTATIIWELTKPKKERAWHGKVANIIPYDLRFPTIERFKQTFWNQDSKQIFTPEFLGVGWGVNFYALLKDLGLIDECPLSEEDFLMPTDSIKKLLNHT